MTTSVLLELLHHKTWATLRLFEYCQSLAPEHLDATMPGTYGSIRDTFRHLLRADEGYFKGVTGADLGEYPNEAGLGVLAERFRSLAKRWETVLLDPAAAERETENRWGYAKGVAPLAQSIHHADDHRTHILSILGARGLEVPELDIWAHGAELGFVRYKEEAATA
jgi:uncharacterized damage-inducible protein DinB